MSDEKPPMPPQPETKAFPAVTVSTETVNDLLREMKGLTNSMSGLTRDFGEMREDFGGLRSDVRELKQRVGKAEERLDASSIRAKEPSVHDLTSQAELSQERIAREGLAATVKDYGVKLSIVEAKTDAQTVLLKEIRDTVIGFATNKKVLFVGKAIFAAAVAYSGLHGLKVLP